MGFFIVRMACGKYKYLYTFTMRSHSKPIEFLGNSLDELRQFPQEIRREAGHQLDRVQQGMEPDDWKPMKTIGSGVKEIRIKDANGAFRVLYVAKLKDAIYVLHCFQKKTEKTAQTDLNLAGERYNTLMRNMK